MSGWIDREKAIEDLQNGDPSQLYDLEDIKYWLNCLPSAQPEQQWIPCSERLPEDDVEVFVYLFERPAPYIAWVEDCRWYTEDFEVEKENYPTAWMSLPKPYKEEE